MTPPWNLEHANHDLVRVRRLRLLAPMDQARGLRGELERVPWPAAPDQSWVLIRELRVAAPKAALGQRARQRVGDLVRAAVSLDSPGAGGAEAVRCDDLPALLAALSLDLASGRAQSRWYWRAWSALFRMPVGLAIATLLGEQPQALAATTERLARYQGLATVWGALSAADAARLAEPLAAWLGRPLPAPPARPLDQPASADDRPRLPQSLVRRWSLVLHGLAWNHPSRWLAACLCTLEWRPLWLSPGAGEAVGWISAALGSETPARDQAAIETSARGAALATTGGGEVGNVASRERLVAQSRADRLRAPDGDPSAAISAGRLHAPSPGLARECAANSTAEPWQEADASAQGPNPQRDPETTRERDPNSSSDAAQDAVWHGARVPKAARARAADLARVRVSAPASRARVLKPPSDGLSGGRSADAAEQSSGAALAPRQGASAEPERDLVYSPEASVIASDFGGVFFLINFLSRPEAQVRLTTQSDYPLHEQGWAWLWDLGMRLGLEPEAALNAFFAERLGLDHPDDLQQLPRLPIGAELFDLGERLYGADTFNTALPRVPARLHHTASHLDIDLPLASVRLPVRQVALDLDPGWVPWLGRVVRFHYRERWHASGGGQRG